jgi:glycosyltransferase involved in cell wall biosynthesis
MKRVLLIAYHYPPARGSSGLQRTLKFSRYLQEFGWSPSVLTVAPRAHPLVGNDQMGEIPPDVEVARSFALDTARHLSFKGSYPRWLASPDRWASWHWRGVPIGLSMVRRLGIDVLWSTYPIATAHKIGLSLHRRSGRPWIADFRDSMTEENYPADPDVRRVFRTLEKQVIERSAFSVFTTPGTVRMYQERYPNVAPQRMRIIENGYDEENFATAERKLPAAPTSGGSGRPATSRQTGGPITLVHSGILYPSERDPTAFLGALQDLKRSGVVSVKRLKVVLRATGHDAHIARLIAQFDVADLVELAPSVAYVDALAETLSADGLLLFQAANCNHQIPAKLYEYLRAGRPILALTDSAGDTAATLRGAGVESIAQLDQRADIVAHLTKFLTDIENGSAMLVSRELASRYSRRAQARELAALLDETLAAAAA